MIRDFGQVMGARSVGRSCFLYLGTRAPHVLGVGGLRCSDNMICDICRDWSIDAVGKVSL